MTRGGAPPLSSRCKRGLACYGTENETVLATVPAGVVIFTAPAGTMAVINPLAPTEKMLLVGVPWKTTALARTKFAPAITTLEPTGPSAGKNQLTSGFGFFRPPL